MKVNEHESTSADERMDAVYCAGYVDGVTDAQTMWRNVDRERGLALKFSFCLPESAETGQVVRVVVKWLKDNPAELHGRADSLIARALAEGFPCKNANPITAPQKGGPTELGRLYAENFPYIDIAVDRQSLQLWKAIDDSKDDAQAAARYGELVKGRKVFPVELDTIVRVEERLGEDCRVRVASGKELGKTGWVQCWMIVNR